MLVVSNQYGRLGAAYSGDTVLHRISEQFVLDHPECLEVRRTLDLMPLLLQDERVGSLAEVLFFTRIIEREFQVLQGLLLRLS